MRKKPEVFGGFNISTGAASARNTAPEGNRFARCQLLTDHGKLIVKRESQGRHRCFGDDGGSTRAQFPISRRSRRNLHFERHNSASRQRLSLRSDLNTKA
jgi:hypothetical protein